MIDTKALREKILDLAIRGKLVPQDPNDEPASVLLERIRAQKQQMVKEGKLKSKDIKNDTIIFKGEDNLHYEQFQDGTVKCIEDEIPFEIPGSWEWCRVGNLFSHNTGKALNSSDSNGTRLTYITTSNLYWDRFELESLNKMPFTESEIEKCTVKKGDLLVCEGGDIGRAAVWMFDEEIRIQNHIHRLRPYIVVSTRFYYYVLYFWKCMGRIGGHGIGLQGFSSKVLHNLLIPLPPFNEQTAIVNQLDFISNHLENIEVLNTELQFDVTSMKSRILDLAIRGKLVPQDPNDEPASVLLERIRAEKEELIKQGNIKRDKKESVIFKGEDNSYYHHIENGSSVYDKIIELPNNWIPCTITDISYIIGNKENQVKMNEININGIYPVISQSQNYVDGYCDLEKKVIKDVPVLLFGDHTRVVKYIDYPFVIGADGTKIHKIIYANEKFIYYWMKYASSLINSKGYARHYSLLKKSCLLLPPLAEQKRIVEAIETAFAQLDRVTNCIS